MKKIALILSLVLMLAACGAQTPETTAPAAAATAPEGACADLMNSLYENVPVELALMPETTETSLSDAEMIAYLTGLPSNVGVADVAVSMPMMGSRPTMLSWSAPSPARRLLSWLSTCSTMPTWPAGSAFWPPRSRLLSAATWHSSLCSIPSTA